jgi:tetratricopeptide (TPR) repeat protein
MKRDMPQRPKQHRREDVSKRVWEKVLPSTWTYAPSGQREYGIDGEIEIFDGDNATGLKFNIQLKGVDKPDATKALIKSSTRNYWKNLDSPTLVVLVDANETVHFGWSHQFDVFGRRENAASYNFELPSIWDDDSAERIEREVRAARAARYLRSNLPIFWEIAADDSVPPQWLSALRASLERRLSSHSELTRRRVQAGDATIEIRVEGDDVSVRLHGTPGGVLHYNGAVHIQRPVAISADVLIGIAVEIERGGLDILSVALIEAATAESLMLGTDEVVTAFATQRVAEAGNGDAALALVERIAFDETLPLQEFVLIVLNSRPNRLTQSATTRIAERVAEYASGDLADGLASTFLYNAGSMIAKWDPKHALELYDSAAERFPSYRKRSYWWRERGSMSFELGDFESAAEFYEEAIRLADGSSVPLLADVYCAMGLFHKAAEKWNEMRNITRSIWVLKMWAAEQICTELGIQEQKRDATVADALYVADATGLEVMRADALHPFGLWRAALDRRESGAGGYAALYIAAACFLRVDPIFWFEALIAVQHEEDDPATKAEFCSLIVMSAVQETGEAFRLFVLEDDHVAEESREELLGLIDSVDLPDEPFVIRRDGVQVN